MTDDLSTFDGREPIELSIGTRKLQLLALRRPLTPNEDVGRAAWHVRVSQLLDATPRVGDTLRTLATDPEEMWTIVQVERLAMGTRWKLTCERAT